jgi:preprotein translocase subunit SecF
MLNLIRQRKIWYVVSTVLFAAAIAIWFVKPPEYSIDFTGGSLLEVKFSDTQPSAPEIKNVLEDGLGLKSLTVIAGQNKTDAIRMEQIDEAKRVEVMAKLQEKFPGVSQDQFNSIGPTIGKELRQKSFVSIALVALGIVLFIAYAFRKISRPVQSWKYGIAAIVALLHDITILAGLYVFLSPYLHFEVDTLFVSALLTILGYSVSDTIVTFDRVRDNLARAKYGNFEELVNHSLNQVLTRSLNTAMATLLPLSALYLFGGDTIKPFVFTLLFGIVIGTYSSIFIASPLIVTWQLHSSKKKA